MADQTFEITAPDGRTLEITGDHMPTEAEMKQIFSATSPSRAKPVSKDETGDYGQAFRDSLKHTAYEAGAGALEHLNPLKILSGMYQGGKARAETRMDPKLGINQPVTGEPASKVFSNPRKMGGMATDLALLGLAPRVMEAAPEAMFRGGERLAGVADSLDAHTTPAGITKAGIKTTGNILRGTGKKLGGEPFSQRPLAEQMSQLPTRGVAPEGRPSAPPVRDEVPFSQRPLYQQMDEIPSNPVGENPRMGGPVASPSRPTMQAGRVVGKAPTTEDALQQVIQDLMGGSDKAATSTAAPGPDLTATGRPGVTADRYSEMNPSAGQSYIDHLKSTNPPEAWHSGAEPGSPEAQSARSLHADEGELDKGYSNAVDDDVLQNILRMLGR